MNIDEEIARLKAEAMATQFLLSGLFVGLHDSGPPGVQLVKHAFTYAERYSEIASTKFGGPDHALYLTTLAKVIEDLRKAVGNNHPGPHDAV
mgnify:CR=1